MNGKKYFWNDISHGKEIEVGGVNNWIGLRNRVSPLPTTTEGTVVVENPVEQGLLNNRNPHDGLVHTPDGKKYFWDGVEQGKSVEVGGVNTNRYAQHI